MANISDLATSDPLQSPSWISALGKTGEFVAQLPMQVGAAPGATSTDRSEAESDADYQRGFADGVEAAKAEADEALAAQGKLRAALLRLDAAAQAALRDHLTTTVAQLCEQIIEPHLIDRAALEQRCEVAIATLAENIETCVLHVHPEDVALFDGINLRDLTVKKDEGLARGSLRLEGREGVVRDGPEDWRRAIAQALRS